LIYEELKKVREAERRRRKSSRYIASS
jgi:hypothetical protein